MPPRKAGGGDAFVGSLAITLGGSGLGALLTMVNEAMVSRYLGLHGYGLYAIGMMLVKIAEIVAVCGLPISILHFLPVHLSRSERSLALGTIVGAIAMPLAVSLGLAASIRLGADSLARGVFHAPAAAPFIAILCLAVPALVCSELLGNVARGFGRPVVYVLIRNVVPALGYAAMIVAISRTGALGLGIGTAYCIATGIAALFGIVAVWRLVRRRIGLVRPELRLRHLYGYALPIALNSIVAIIIAWTDLVCLAIFATPEQVGMYRACMQVAVAFDLIWNACSAATAPLYPLLIAEQQWTRLQALYSASIRVAMLLALPLLVVLVTNSGDVLGLLNPGFRIAATALAILATGHAIKTVFGAASVMLVLGGSQVREACNGAAAAVLNLILNLALVPTYGLVGAATATAIALVSLAALRCWQVREVFRLVSLSPLLYRFAAATGFVIVATIGASSMLGWQADGRLLLLLVRVATATCVLACLLWFVCLAREDRADLLQLLPFRQGRLARAKP